VRSRRTAERKAARLRDLSANVGQVCQVRKAGAEIDRKQPRQENKGRMSFDTRRPMSLRGWSSASVGASRERFEASLSIRYPSPHACRALSAGARSRFGEHRVTRTEVSSPLEQATPGGNLTDRDPDPSPRLNANAAGQAACQILLVLYILTVRLSTFLSNTLPATPERHAPPSRPALRQPTARREQVVPRLETF